jgi:hypothetical protein
VILLVAVRQLRALNAQGKLSRELVLDPNRDSAARESLVCPPGRATVSTMARERTIVPPAGCLNRQRCTDVILPVARASRSVPPAGTERKGRMSAFTLAASYVLT